MSRIRKKLAALHKPRPTACPAPSAPRTEAAPEAAPSPAPAAASTPASAPVVVAPPNDRPLRVGDLAAWRARRGTEAAATPAAAPTAAPEAPRAVAAVATPVVRSQAAPAASSGRPSGHRHLSQLIEGYTWYAPPELPLFIARRGYALHERIGHGRLADARALGSAVLGELAGTLAVAPERALFLDLETTGLSARGGDLAFLVGVATWSGDALEVEVLTLHDPSEERASLLAVSSLVARASVLVTYNGASFDVPFLRTRLEAHGLDAGVLRRPHIDLRQVVRRALPDRKGPGMNKLPALERDLLGLERGADVPGSEAPGRWRAYLASADARHIAPLVAHNLHDLVSLPLLLARLSRPVAASAEHRGDPHRLLVVARQVAAQGRVADAIALYEGALDAELDPRAAWAAQKALAQLLERSDQVERAIAVYEALTRTPHTDPLPHTRLATLYRARGDDGAADRHAEAARRLAPWKR